MSKELRARDDEWASLMRAAMGGDSQSYHRFLAAVTPYLRGMANRRCYRAGVPVSEVEDIVQEVLLAVHAKRGTWDTARPIGPWLSAIVRNKMIDNLRRRSRNSALPIEDFEWGLAMEETGEITDRMDAETAMALLKPRQREIVRALSIDGSDVKETAERLGMTEGAVRVVLHRALKFLAGHYGSK